MALPELQDGAQSKQKAEYVSHTLSKRGKSDYIELTYKRLDGPNPGVESKTGNFVTALNEASRNLIKAKGTFVVVKTKDGKFWPLTGVESMDTYVAKPASTFNKGGYGGSVAGGGKTTTTFNNAGIKVGAVLHDAVALYSTLLAVDKTQDGAVKTVKQLAEELLHISFELEANVNAGKYEPSTASKALSVDKTVFKNATITGKLSEEVVEQEDSLDNIDF